MDNRSIETQLTDEELAVRAQAGSRPCFEELVYRYSHRLFHYFRHKMSNDQDIEDLVQETFLKAYQNIRRFSPEYKFSTWFYTIASRLAISYFRREGAAPKIQNAGQSADKIRTSENINFFYKPLQEINKTRVNEPAFESAYSSQNPQERMIQEENYKSIWKAAQTLQQYQYEALWLRYVEDMSVKEIARVLKKSQVHVRVLLHRARLNLIKRINPSAPPGEIEEVDSVEKKVTLKKIRRKYDVLFYL
jgi:RNA polymerase sigma-70 factor (ECF subfamily)